MKNLREYKKSILMTLLVLCLMTTGCAGNKNVKKELVILAAASLTDVCSEIEKNYEDKHPGTDLIFSFGGSGALQTQIEEGAPADVFFSAARKQMDALKEKELMIDESIKDLLENKIVLIVPADSDAKITSFQDAATEQVKVIGLGEPGSVPAGQYAEEVFTSLSILEEVSKKANYGQDVRTVLTWVEEGAVDCGVVYATDAYSTDKVKITCTAPEGSCKQVLYPVGIVRSTRDQRSAKEFIDFLCSKEAMDLFEKYGFSPVK